MSNAAVRKGASSKTGTHKTPPILLKALKTLRVYTGATGAQGCILDQNYLPIPEEMDDISGENNLCLFCIKYRSCAEKPKTPRDFSVSPCHAVHTNAVKKACHYGGAYLYICDMGFVFWTCPIIQNGHFSGAILGSGFLGTNPDEIVNTMLSTAGEGADESWIRSHVTFFPSADTGRVKALSELLLTCAESLADAGEDYHETLRRRAMQQSVISEQIALLREQYPEGGPMPGYPLDRERMLLMAMRRGDHEAGKRILNEILGVLFYTNPDHFSYIRFRAMELVVLLSRTVAAPGLGDKSVLESNNHYLRQIQEVENIGELTDALHSIVETMAGQILSFQGVRHAAALQKAERYIFENFTRKISLKEIAENSGLSAPYFSTIFREEMGENLSSYLNRLRVEKAGRLLTETDMSLAEIAGSCGFEDQSWFSKIFKSFTGISPGKYRSQGGSRVSDLTANGLAGEENETAPGGGSPGGNAESPPADPA